MKRSVTVLVCLLAIGCSPSPTTPTPTATPMLPIIPFTPEPEDATFTLSIRVHQDTGRITLVYATSEPADAFSQVGFQADPKRAGTFGHPGAGFPFGVVAFTCEDPYSGPVTITATARKGVEEHKASTMFVCE